MRPHTMSHMSVCLLTVCTSSIPGSVHVCDAEWANDSNSSGVAGLLNSPGATSIQYRRRRLAPR